MRNVKVYFRCFFDFLKNYSIFRMLAQNRARELCILRITCWKLSSPFIYKEFFSPILKGNLKITGSVIAFSSILHITRSSFHKSGVGFASPIKPTHLYDNFRVVFAVAPAKKYQDSL